MTIRRSVPWLVLAAIAFLVAPSRPAAQDQPPLRYTQKTIENEAGVRVILEFTRKPIYEVRGDGSRVHVALREADVEPPFKKKDYGGAVLDKVKFIEGFRTSEIVFYTGDEFSTFSAFEMGEPFRIVLDLRRRHAPQPAVVIPGPRPLPGQGGAEGPGGRAAQTPGTPGAGAPPPPLPPMPAATPVPAKPRPAFTVVIDPGHGGDDAGARGPSGLLEKDVTLDLARRLKARILMTMDAAVILTRDGDTTLSLDDRTALANHHRADLFLCVHANASRRGNARGAETYFLSYQATDDESRTVAAIENNTLGLDAGVQQNSGLEMILWDLAQTAFLKESSALAEIIQDKLNDALGITNRGIKQAPFRVLMGATMPAVLVEVGFISNPEEEKRLRDTAFKDRLAAALVDSVARYRDTYVQARAR